MYLIEKINEGFQSGSATKLVSKIAGTLGRRLGKSVAISSVPIPYQNSDGKYLGFMGYVSGLDRVFRVNFELTGSDTISTLDLYNGDLSKPYITVRFDNMNIVQIIESMVLELETTVVDKSLFESKFVEYTAEDRKQQLFKAWLEEEKDALDMLQNKALSSVYTFFIKKDKYNSEINFVSFKILVKQYLFGMGLTNPTFRARKKGSAEREIIDKAKQDQIQDLVETMAWEKKFKYLESAVEAVVDDKIQSLICYGSPGSGKTETIMAKLKALGVTPKIFSGGFKNADEVFKVLTKYSNDQILVFDDCDSVMKNLELKNMFKSALQNSQSREVTWRDKILDFHSGVIFISNLQKFDPAIASRSMNIEISLSNEQMLQKIDSTLKTFMPEVDMKTKKAALEFLKEIQSGVKTVDYREIQKVIIAMQIQPNDWKDFALLMISSQ